MFIQQWPGTLGLTSADWFLITWLLGSAKDWWCIAVAGRIEAGNCSLWSSKHLGGKLPGVNCVMFVLLQVLLPFHWLCSTSVLILVKEAAMHLSHREVGHKTQQVSVLWGQTANWQTCSADLSIVFCCPLSKWWLNCQQLKVLRFGLTIAIYNEWQRQDRQTDLLVSAGSWEHEHIQWHQCNESRLFFFRCISYFVPWF